MRGAFAAIAGITGILGWILFVLAILGNLATQRASKFEMKREIAALQSQLVEKGRALKKADGQLAPFFAFAAEHFPGATPDEQLEKLRDYFATAKLPPMRRYIEPTAIERIRLLLKDAPASTLATRTGTACRTRVLRRVRMPNSLEAALSAIPAPEGHP